MEERIVAAIEQFEEQQDKIDARYRVNKKRQLAAHLVKALPEFAAFDALLQAAKTTQTFLDNDSPSLKEADELGRLVASAITSAEAATKGEGE